MSYKPKGIFINTAQANCSIHESGKMVYNCLSQSDQLDIDYYSIDMIDIKALAEQGVVKVLLGSDVAPPRSQCDFWVFNWHFVTMARDLDPKVIAALPGPKFTVVLELAPGDPLQLVPPGVFDAYMALDPGATRAGAIYPFPRPLDGDPRIQTRIAGDVPVIGSFGFGTPGKGFENLLAAVNHEFDRAVVRVNIPSGTFIGTDNIHRESYPKYIEKLCKNIAKPGVSVDFTYDFLSPEDLIDWCSENDLNCFMYTRCQPGLSATTDQAIISGQPLVTSSNDTFRHIHQYIPPYPLTSLRDAMVNTRPQVEAMQRDWSKSAFNSRFAEILADFGILQDARYQAVPATPAMAGSYKLLIAHRRPIVGGIYSRVNRLADAMRRTGKYVVSQVELDDDISRGSIMSLEAIDAVILADTGLLSLSELEGFSGPVVLLNHSVASIEQTADFRVTAPFMPIIPYQTVNVAIGSHPTIWMVGFSAAPEILSVQLQRIAAELPGAKIHVLRLPCLAEDHGAEKLDEAILSFDNITVTLEPLPESGEEVIAKFAASHLIMINNDLRWTDHLQNIAELAMITERSVAICASPSFPKLSGMVACYDDYELSALIEMGCQAQIAALSAFAEGQTYARIDSALGPWLGVSRTPLEHDNPGSKEEHLELVHRLYREFLGRGPDPQGLRHYLGLLASGKTEKRLARDISKSQEAFAYRQARNAPEQSITSVRDLLALRGSDFVRGAYLTLLGREPDPVGLAHHLGLLEDGESRAAIVSGLHLSAEGRNYSPNLIGLDRLLNRQQRRWPRWINVRRPLKNAAAQRRKLNAAEFRLAELAAMIAHRPSETSFLQRALDRLPPVPQIEPASGQASAIEVKRIILPRSSPETVYLLVQVQDFSKFVEIEGLKRFATSLRASGKLLRLVLWDPLAKRIELASREAIADGAWKAVLGRDIDWYASSKDVKFVLDNATVNSDDTLIVYGPVRSSLDAEIIVETNLILECRRLGLPNVFIFPGARELTSQNYCKSACLCEEQYMQSLMLADSIIATSPQAMMELEGFFSGYQRAATAPVRAVVSAPNLDDTDNAWRVFAKQVREGLETLRDPANFIDCFIHRPSGRRSGAEKTLASSVAAIATDLTPKAGSHSKKLLKESGGSGSAGGKLRRQWLLVDGGRSIDEIRAALGKGSKKDTYSAILLFDKAAVDTLVASNQGLECLTSFDLLVCSSSELVDIVRNAILSTRLRFPSAKDRLVSLESSEDSPAISAMKLLRLLANLQPQAWQSALPLISYEQAKLELPWIRNRPKLSLCISTYNRAKWLQTSLANIARQIPHPRDDLEIVVVDNASTDETSSVPELFSDRSDFRFFRNPINVGMLGNLAVTAQRAEGDYVWILGDDDLTRSGVIESILSLLSDKPHIELVYLNYGYTSEATPSNLRDIDEFLDGYNVLQPPCPDEEGDVASLAAKTENFYTAIYSHIYRRDHAIRSYCQDTSGRIFSTMQSCIPTTRYVLGEMPHSPAYWVGEPSLVVNSNVSWADYGPMLDLEHLPASWDMAERIGCPVEQIDMRRENRLWLVEMMWKQLFENDGVDNRSYLSASDIIMRLRHLPGFEKYVPEFRGIYSAAHIRGDPAAAISPQTLFAAFADI